MEKRALITGATGGIGKNLAKIFARNHYDLVLTSTKLDKLNALKEEIVKEFNVKVDVLEVNLSSDNGAKLIKEYTDSKDYFINILVNNAGFGNFGDFYEIPYEKENDLLNVNIKALTELTYIYLQNMVKYKEGKILNVGSIASFASGPYLLTYYASKNYVLAFSYGLAKEVKKHNISVTCLCPGTTDTGFEKRANLDNSKLFSTLRVATPEKVAEYGYKKLMKKKEIAIYGASNRFLIFMIRFSPRRLVRSVICKIQDKRKAK